MKKDFNKIIPDLERLSAEEFNTIHGDENRNILSLLKQLNNKTLELEIDEAARFLENLKNEIKFYNKYNTPNLTFIKDQYKDMVEVVIEINLTDTPPTLYKFKIKKLHLFELNVQNNTIEILKSFDGQTFDLTVNQQLMLLEFIDGIIAKYNGETNETEILERHVYKIQKNSGTHVIHKISENKLISECIIKFDII